jgi:hypothetical protein
MQRVALSGLLSLAIITVGCGSNSSSSPTSPSTPAAPTLSTVSLSTDVAALNRSGATAQITATGTLSSGSAQNVTGACTNWQSDNGGVVTVSSGGLLTAQSSGSATITTTCQGIQARGALSLTVASKADPQLTGAISVTLSQEPLYLFRAKVNVTYTEASKAFGMNVNFLTLDLYDSRGVHMGKQFSYNPSVFGNVWGSNHIGAGESKGVVVTLDYNGNLVSSIRVDAVTSIQDDLGNVTNFSKTFNGFLEGIMPTALPSLNPNAYRVVQ